MSINSDRKNQVGRPLFLTRVTSQVLCEKAFTLVELMIVIITIGTMLGITLVVWDTTARNMDVQAAAEMFKQDIRTVYARAVQGHQTEVNGIKHRDQYRMEIYTSAAASPATSSYKISSRQWSGSDWSNIWTPVTDIQAAEENRIVNGYIKPGTYNLAIDVQGSSLQMYPLIFEARGSIVHVMDPTTGKAQAVGDTVIKLSSSSKTTYVTVSVYGDVY